MTNPYQVIEINETMNPVRQDRQGRRWLAPFLMLIVFAVCLIGFVPHLVWWFLKKDPPPYICQFFDWCDRVVLGDN